MLDDHGLCYVGMDADRCMFSEWLKNSQKLIVHGWKKNNWCAGFSLPKIDTAKANKRTSCVNKLDDIFFALPVLVSSLYYTDTDQRTTNIAGWLAGGPQRPVNCDHWSNQQPVTLWVSDVVFRLFGIKSKVHFKCHQCFLTIYFYSFLIH